MNLKTAELIEPQVIQRYRGDTFHRVTVLKDAKGRVGGYMIQSAVMDDPVTYLDCDGNHLTAFHIFGTDEDKASATQIITPLMEQFPQHEPLPT